MASRKDLLQSIHPSMRLDKNFFMRIYGYELTYPGFSEIALTALEDAGCSKAREYYRDTVGTYETKQKETMKNVSEWYRKQFEENGKVVNASRKKQNGTEQQRAMLLNRKKQLLMQRLKLLTMN